MTIRRLNHAVLYVSDLAVSRAFYEQVLGFRPLPTQFPGAVFYQAADSANDHDLGLFEVGPDPAPTAGRRPGLYHLAWEVGTLRALADAAEKLSAAGALVGAGDHGSTKALYAKDPDGIDLEVCWLVPDSEIEAALPPGTPPTRPLDIAAEIARYGADTAGGPRTDHAVWARLFAGRH